MKCARCRQLREQCSKPRPAWERPQAMIDHYEET